MTTQQPGDVPEGYPSLEVISRELELQRAEQERRSTGFDTKAGLLLGFGGVLVGLSPETPNVLQIGGQVFAVAAAIAAVWAIFPRVSGAVSPRGLREGYLTTPTETTQLRLLDTRIVLYEQDNDRMAEKVFRLRVALCLLLVAVLLLLIGSMVEAATEGGNDGSRSASAPR
ncbi:MAG: hypothetical protein ACRDO1_04590 [Nocardioidaceae bacterium]